MRPTLRGCVPRGLVVCDGVTDAGARIGRVSHTSVAGGSYRRLFAVEHARALLGWSIVARLPLGMTALSLLLLARAEGASYAAAGAVAAAYGLALAVGAPVAGRLVDRRGPRRILVRRAIAYPTLLGVVVVLALADAPMGAIAAAAAAAGLAVPPVAPTVRSVWPRLVPDELRAAAYGLEASLQEVFFVTGPLLAAVLCAVHPVGGVLGAATAALVGTLAVARLRPVRETAAVETGGGLLGALEAGGVRVLAGLALTVGFGFGTVEVAFPAFAEEHGARELGGVALAALSAGSFVGGIAAGARMTGDPRRKLLVLAPVVAAGIALLALAGSVPTLCLLSFVAGLPIAPAITAAYLLVDRVGRTWAIAESFAWIGTAVMCGVAMGTALGGWLVDETGVRGALLTGALVALSGAGLVFLRREALAHGPA